MKETNPKAFQAFVNKMTNHERNQWARAGYPGLQKKKLSGPKLYAPRLVKMERMEKQCPE